MSTLPLCLCGCGAPVTNSKNRFLAQHHVNIINAKYHDYLARFWSYVQKTETCWLWIGPRSGADTRKYGTFQIAKKKVSAHRFSYELFFGAIPQGLFVCHKCDVTFCVNPKHLWVGTQGDNLKDCFAKGRSPMNKHPELWIKYGDESRSAKITSLQAQEIYQRYHEAANPYGLLSQLGREFGISDVAIRCIVTGKNWSHATSML